MQVPVKLKKRQQARERKRRQRERMAQTGLREMNIRLPVEVIKLIWLETFKLPEKRLEVFVENTLRQSVSKNTIRDAETLQKIELNWPKIYGYSLVAEHLFRDRKPVKFKGYIYTIEEANVLAPLRNEILSFCTEKGIGSSYSAINDFYRTLRRYK